MDPIWGQSLEMAARSFESPAAALQWPTPGHLAAHLNPKNIRTPALDLIDEELVELMNTPDGRLIITMPPQEGKSLRGAGDFPAWALLQQPDWRIIAASYGQRLADRNGRAIRRRIANHPELGLKIARDNGAVSEWTIDGHEGGVFSVGIGGPVTGRPCDLMIIDDPVKSRQEAESEIYRERVWDWWTDEASTRFGAGTRVVLIMCMTGDTPVLRPDGTETPLRDIRPGDEVATFTDEGEVTTSIVSNWMSQGADDTFAVHLASGRVVRANARHPFWVVGEDGNGSWVRLESLRAGMKVRCLTEPTKGLSARQMTATSPRSARACACRITPEHATQQAIDHRRRLMRDGGRSDSKVGTASRLRTTTDSSLSKVSVARSVEDTLVKSPSPRTGPKSSASIIATTPELCEVCSATTATSSLLAGIRLTSFGGPLNTSVVSTDEIVSIVPSGREEVFDIEVVGTHRFIANGLDVSNTRWHDDDFAGRLIEKDAAAGWKVLNIPAQADHDPSKGEADPLGREPGEFMISARGRTDKQWEARKRTAGPRTWNALFQGRPAPAEGALFKREWWKRYDLALWIELADGTRWTTNPGDRIIISADFAFKDTATSDFIAIGVWLKRGPNVYLLDQTHGRRDFLGSCQALEELAARWPQAALKLVEEKANGAAVIATLSKRIPGIVPEIPQEGKVARAHAVLPFVWAGNVWLPTPAIAPWVGAYIEELAAFPTGKHDDQVDQTTQALNRLLVSTLLDDLDEGDHEPEEFSALDEQGFVYSPY